MLNLCATVMHCQVLVEQGIIQQQTDFVDMQKYLDHLAMIWKGLESLYPKVRDAIAFYRSWYIATGKTEMSQKVTTCLQLINTNFHSGYHPEPCTVSENSSDLRGN